MFAYDVLKVIYAPHKVFKDIIQNPKYFGPILILILFAAAQTGAFYSVMSKSYVEQTSPSAEKLDMWTENATLWKGNPGVIIMDNHDDYINGTYYGNRSIEFSMANSRQISMELNNIESINCYSSDGFKNLSLRIKLISSQVPESIIIYLFSLDNSNYFYYSLTNELSSSTINLWNNITIPVGTLEWMSNGADVTWKNITGVKLDFVWSKNSSRSLRIDGLFFRGVFKTFADISGSEYIFAILTTAFTQFVFQWVFLSGLLYLLVRGFRANVSWMPIMVCVGFSQVTMFVQALVNIPINLNLPTLYYPLELMGGVQGEFEIAYNSILEATAFIAQISGAVQGIIYVWTIVLVTIAIRFLTEFTWVKSILVSAVAFLVTILALGFLLGY